MTMLLAGLLARGGTLARGWLEIEGEWIVGVGDGAPPRPPDYDAIAGELFVVLIPQLFDIGRHLWVF